MAKKKYSTARIKQIIRQINGKFEDEEGTTNELITCAMIKDKVIYGAGLQRKENSLK